MKNMTHKKSFQDKTVLITGGSDGIGYATAKLFSEEGAKKTIITGRIKEKLENANVSITGNIVAVQSDTSKLDQISALFDNDAVTDTPIDTLVINAGTVNIEPIEEVTEESFDLQFDTNIKGAFFTVKKSLPFLAENASIILVSSVAAHRGILSTSVYTATKAALSSLAKTLGSELASRGIKVNAISPGYIETPLSKEKNPSEVIEYVSSRTPLGNRGGQPIEVAQAILSLAVGLPFVTGQDLIIDGGLTLQSSF